MKRIIRLTESDLTRIVKRVINEQYDDNWFSGIQTMVASVNSKLPKGCPKLKALGPDPHPTVPTSRTAWVTVDFKSLGNATDGLLMMFSILRQKDGLVTSVNPSFRNPISDGAVVFSSPKTIDPTTKKLEVGPGGQITTGTLFTVGSALQKTPDKSLQLLGSVLKGQKSKNDKGQIVSDYSAIPAEIVNSFNSVIKSLHTMVKAKA
jgi:hypothetical protein